MDRSGRANLSLEEEVGDGRLFSDIVNEIPVGIFRTTLDGEFVAVNAATVSLLEASSRSEVFEHRVEDIYASPDDREALLDRLLEDGLVRDYEVRFRTFEGSERWVSMTAVLSAEDDVPHVEGIVQDIDARKEAERRAAETERRLTQIAESTTDVLWLFGADFEEVLFMNGAYEDLWGRPRSELEADPMAFLESVHEDDVAELEARMARLADGESVDLEYRVEGTDGETRWVWSKGAPVYEGGEVVRVAGFTRDVTERKERERELKEYRERLEASVEELERSNEQLQQFAYVASHDLQEPLRMVASYVDLLATEYEGELDEEADEYIEFAVDGARRMQAMVDGLLQYSRVHTQAQPFERTDADALFEQTLQDLELQIADADAVVTHDPLPEVEADPAQLRQVFQNLVSNALRYGGEGVAVHVSAEEREDAVEFSVADDGPGIPDDLRDDVFDLFSRGHGRDVEGTGIGLTITEQIVDRHGGEIRVESGAGEGATFRFTIPRNPTAVPEGVSD
ncbi:MAG: ATP-binding protein [Halobacteriaceae archaeon]